MKKLTNILFTVVVAMTFFACHDNETYADQKKKESAAISQFIQKKGIKKISEKQFIEQGYTTDVSKNEFVEFSSTGIYMQIVRKGTGKPIGDGEKPTMVLCRFDEYNLLTDSLQLSNNVLIYAGDYDKFSVKNTSGTYSASFVYGVMMTWYKSSSVPAGWLAPLPYINIGRQDSEDSEVAKVNIIVPHTQGHKSASAGVYPCYYEITYQRSN